MASLFAFLSDAVERLSDAGQRVAVVLGEERKGGGADVDDRVGAVLDREADDDAHLVVDVLARTRADEEITRIALKPTGLAVLGLRERVTDLGLRRLAHIDAPIAVLRDQRGGRSGACSASALRRLRILFRLRRLFRILLRLRLGRRRRRLRERSERQANGKDARGKANEKRARGHGDFLSLSCVWNLQTRTNYFRTDEK